MWSARDLHLAYQPHRPDLLVCDSINLATLKPQKEAPRMVRMTGLKDPPFSPHFCTTLQHPLWTNKKCLVLLKGATANIHVNWMAKLLDEQYKEMCGLKGLPQKLLSGAAV